MYVICYIEVRYVCYQYNWSLGVYSELVSKYVGLSVILYVFKLFLL